MVNPKYVVVCSCVGLVLSFIICLISHISAGTMFLRALIFAVVFGILCAVIQIVFNKFLATGEGALSDGSGGSRPAGSVGTVINISVGDDKLPDEEAAPKFVVKNTAPVLVSEGPEVASYSRPDSASGAASSESPAQASAETSSDAGAGGAAGGFKPMDLSSVTTKSDSLDELPDIADVSSSQPSNSSATISNISDGGSETAFASGGGAGGRSSSSSGDSQDALLAAKAISTLLAKDN
jgi:hypothetical protein